MHEIPFRLTRGLGDFSHPDNSARLNQIKKSFGDDINQALESNTWISNDITVAERRKIPAGDWKMVWINLPDLGPFSDQPVYSVALARLATRSRHAQVGLEIQEDGRMTIGETIELNKDLSIRAQTMVFNHSERDIALKTGDGIGYFVYWKKGPMVDEELETALQTVTLGEEDEDWRKHHSPDGTFSGVELFIDPDTRRTIAPGKKPIRINHGHASLHNRAEVNKYLIRLPDVDSNGSTDTLFVVSETRGNVYIPAEIHGICVQHVWRTGLIDIQSFQTDSFLLKGGNTGKPDLPNPIRTEHAVSPKGKLPDSLIVEFIKA